MAKYTIELRKLTNFYREEEILSWFSSYKLEDYLTQDEIECIQTRGTWSKEKLAKKIFNHYYMREIGFETPALFKHYALTTMNEIMEEKLPLIYSASVKYDMMVNVDYTETYERNINGINQINGTSSGNSSSSNNSNAEGITIQSDTPQGEISLNNILQGKYASQTSGGQSTTQNETSDTVSNSRNENSTNNTNEEYTKKIKGNSGVSATAQKMVEQYRNNIIAIDKSIIEELNILFMGIY